MLQKSTTWTHRNCPGRSRMTKFRVEVRENRLWPHPFWLRNFVGFYDVLPLLNQIQWGVVVKAEKIRKSSTHCTKVVFYNFQVNTPKTIQTYTPVRRPCRLRRSRSGSQSGSVVSLPRSLPAPLGYPHPAAPVAMATPPAASLTVALVRRRRGSAAVSRSPSPHKAVWKTG